MAKNPILHLEGADALNKALRDIGNRAGGLVLRKAANAGAEVIAEEARRNAPRDSGELQDSIGVQDGRIQQGRAQMDIGFGKKAWYGSLLEFGTKFIAARPFLRPALDTKAEEATEKVGESLRASMKDVLS